MIRNIELFKAELDKVNEWWITDKVNAAEKYINKREKFHTMVSQLDNKRIIILLGPRRVGKSILMKHLVSQLLKSVTKKNILYLSADDPAIQTYTDNLIKDVIDYFLDDIAEKGRKYIFLDEIHRYKDWYKWLKSYYDRDLDIKFFISGSSSLALQKEANQYLRGRTIEIDLYQLDFQEFLAFKGIEMEKIDINAVFELDEFKIKGMWYKIKESFEEYLLVGGFPEWFEISDKEKWFSMLIDDIPRKAIYEDLSNIFEIRNLKALELMFTFIAANQSRLLAYETINDIVKLDHDTLTNYIEFLKSSYLIFYILKHASLKEQLKAKKKYLVIDQGLRNAILKDYELRENNTGFIIENVVGINLFIKHKERNETINYISNGEIDFVVKNKHTVPIEIKYRHVIKNSDIKNLLSFMIENKLEKGIVITKDLLKKDVINGKKILFIPVWLFLLTL